MTSFAVVREGVVLPFAWLREDVRAPDSSAYVFARAWRRRHEHDGYLLHLWLLRWCRLRNLLIDGQRQEARGVRCLCFFTFATRCTSAQYMRRFFVTGPQRSDVAQEERRPEA